jgi:hypothetical protein
LPVLAAAIKSKPRFSAPAGKALINENKKTVICNMVFPFDFLTPGGFKPFRLGMNEG